MVYKEKGKKMNLSLIPLACEKLPEIYKYLVILLKMSAFLTTCIKLWLSFAGAKTNFPEENMFNFSNKTENCDQKGESFYK